MKKRYKKPQIFMESFQVSEFIAANCATNQNALPLEELDPSKPTEFGGVTLFNVDGCEYGQSDFTFADNDKPCYDIPVRSLSTHS
ncbi:hypothetical protein H8S10_01035 [Clostridium sp. NSJ-49]|uniref:hypothetical protein n=1 Tax=Clostridium TaxID=1485 RepID=UPI00164BB329|nr:hypothetical protein [Clostridium sp. NSJ-49]MBC5624044.1 hypothetical protein [Clostridium sp. NSJ-49]